MGKTDLLFVLSILFVAQLFANGIDQTKFQNQKVFTTNINGNYFGLEAKAIGDFNSDGFGDLAVGAELENSSTGAVYIYFGGEEFNTTVDVALKGNFAGEGFGHAISPAGDFNGDGFGDLMISSYSSTGSFVQIYFGGPWFDLYPDVTIQRIGTDIIFADKIAKLGDVNGDNYDDIAIKANGKVHIYYGKSAFTTVLQPDYTISVNCSDLTYAGDVNGDGFEDIAVANEASSIVYVYAGGTLLSSTPGVTFTGNYGSYLGHSISGGKDINRDGFSDIIVGAPSEGQNGTNSGAAYIYYGSANILKNNGSAIYSSVQIYGNTAEARFGNNVQFLSDVNGDGFDETAVGNLYSFGTGSNSVNIYFGDYQFSGATNSIINSDGEYYFGAEIASTDFDGDGYSEIFVSAPYNDKVFSYSVKMRGVINAFDNKIPAGGYVEFTGGDFNGDGFDDIVAVDYSNNLCLTLGGKDITKLNKIEFFGGVSKNTSFVGDLNRDGFDEFVTDGRIYWGTNATDPNLIEYTYLSANTLGSGDVNGDGNIDLIVEIWDNLYAGYFLEWLDFNLDGTYVQNRFWDIELSTIANEAKFLMTKVIDLNNDGYDDIVYVGRGYNDDFEEVENLEVFWGATDNFYGEVRTVLHFYSDYVIDRIDEIGDFNNDGNKDLLIEIRDERNWSESYSLITWFNSATDSFEHFDLTNIESVAYGDINNDGFSDFMDVNKKIYFGNRNFALLPDLTINDDEIELNPYFIQSRLFGDINGDNQLDIIARNTSNSPNYATNIYLNSGFENAPGFLSVKDVPADQGGKVTLAWTKSALDGSSVTSYQIERSIAPVGSGFAWEVIGDVPVSLFNAYSFTAPTLNDDNLEFIGNTYFRITALTENPTVFYRSNILFGHSSDNLAPRIVEGLNASLANNSAKISWKLNTESDLKEYIIYRDEKENVNIDTLVALSTTTDSVFYDKSPLKSAYYFIVAKDIHDNISEPNQILLKFTDIKNETEIIKDYALFQNYPNPYNPATNIKFNLPKSEFVTLKIFDIIGNEVATLVNEQKSAGSFTIKFDASNLTSGIYLYQLQAGSFREIKKMMLVK